jgi:hypothetical protein
MVKMFRKGKSYFFRAVTYHLVGEIVTIETSPAGVWVELKNASWIADSGRFTQAIKDGKLNEVEPVGKAYLNLASVTDAFPWVHELPKEQK